MCVIVMFRDSNTHVHDVGAHAYYTNSGVTRAVRTCYSGYSDSLLENDRNAHEDHAIGCR